MPRRTRPLLAGALAIAVIHGGACGKSAPPLDPKLADVVFQGGADGVALDQLLAATPKMDAARAPVIDSPPNDTLVPAATAPTFKWHLPGATAARAPALLPAARPASPSWLRELVGPERAARADELAMNGNGYLVLFSTSETPRLLRVFTTGTSYTPDAKAWKTLVSAGTWTNVVVVAGAFADDQLVADGGPVESASIAFCVER
jgi:hypothetical protein